MFSNSTHLIVPHVLIKFFHFSPERLSFSGVFGFLEFLKSVEIVEKGSPAKHDGFFRKMDWGNGIKTLLFQKVRQLEPKLLVDEEIREFTKFFFRGVTVEVDGGTRTFSKL